MNKQERGLRIARDIRTCSLTAEHWSVQLTPLDERVLTQNWYVLNALGERTNNWRPKRSLSRILEENECESFLLLIDAEWYIVRRRDEIFRYLVSVIPYPDNDVFPIDLKYMENPTIADMTMGRCIASQTLLAPEQDFFRARSTQAKNAANLLRSREGETSINSLMVHNRTVGCYYFRGMLSSYLRSSLMKIEVRWIRGSYVLNRPVGKSKRLLVASSLINDILGEQYFEHSVVVFYKKKANHENCQSRSGLTPWRNPVERKKVLGYSRTFIGVSTARRLKFIIDFDEQTVTKEGGTYIVTERMNTGFKSRHILFRVGERPAQEDTSHLN
jgi:hypothetical protein